MWQDFCTRIFQPGSSRNRYVGIWYYQIPQKTVVWVANRVNPINDTSGILSVNSRGNLALYQRNQTLSVWSTNISITGTRNSIAQLLDPGNLVLLQNDTRRTVLWQSFDYPTNTMLPSMKIGNRKLFLQDQPNWVSLMVSVQGFISFVASRVMDGAKMERASIFTTVIASETGLSERLAWNNEAHRWIVFSAALPQEQCDFYLHCGPNSYCNPNERINFECTCFPGFEPKSSQEWYTSDGGEGCVRKRGVSTCRSGEGFVKVACVKVPDTSEARVDMSLGLKSCEDKCLRNCSCVAYASAYYKRRGFGGCKNIHGFGTRPIYTSECR
ncbi:hypothetical protein DITRI_Ditri15bG0053800 [Diplodiscus trichospermus]